MMSILRSDAMSQIKPFSRESFYSIMVDNKKLPAEQETGKKIDCKRS